MEMLLPPVCTKLCHQKPLDLKDDNTEIHCPVTVNPWHMKKAFKVMNELRSQNLLCDVTIVAEDMEIAAHRVVLAACSPYFHAMFTGCFQQGPAVVLVHFSHSPEKKILKFIIIVTSMNPAIYTSQVDLYSHPVICKFKQASLIP